jgi:DNA-binding CsgD family transcriptional regulator/Tfp pilus assembly protein PilF
MVLRSAQQSLELGRACGDDFAVPTALRVLAQGALRAGRFHDATSLAEQAASAADAAGNDWEAGLTLAASAAIEVRQGKLKSAQRSYEGALDVLSDNNRWGAAQVRYGMGMLARARGDTELAIRQFEEAAETFRELDSWPEIARCLGGVGWTALMTGDLSLADSRLAESLRLSQACGQRLGVARGLEAFAALAAARQQTEQAVRLAGAACQLRESLGQPSGIGPRMEEALELARDRLGASAAAALFAEGREMTPEEAAGYALGSGRGTPAAGQAAWADPARLAAVGRPRQDGAAARGNSPLTPREHEIVLLIARGLSNRQIADELVISPATAARHVANILAKLGFSSRTQVASWAARQDPPR